MDAVKIIDCPRDAMQGISEFIPTDLKVKYINQLLKVGFDTIDFGSFVSPKAIPQLKDTGSVLSRLELEGNSTKLSAIVANYRGAASACEYDEIHYLGYPFSISETFQQRNTKQSMEESIELVAQIQNLCEIHSKEMIVYISMAFGNPYNDLWDEAIVAHWIDRVNETGVHIVNLSDTVGIASAEQIGHLFYNLALEFPKIEIGAHLHCRPDNWEEKIKAAFENGCMRFDGAIKGFGGCPFAKDELVGNVATENIIQFIESQNIPLSLDKEELLEAISMSKTVF